MDLGSKLKQARLEAGLSQRQLCGDRISRNMLSLIENGSAKPSMDTLSYLAQKLDKSLSYFLEETAVTSPNQQAMSAARAAFSAADPATVLQALENYRRPDEVFDFEYALLTALSAMDLAEKAIRDGKTAYAETLLEKAELSSALTPYCAQALQHRRLLLSFRARPESAVNLASQLPDITDELLLRARAALAVDDPSRCLQLLDAASTKDERWHFLRGEAFVALGDYTQAAKHYLRAQEFDPRGCFARLEQCYRELQDYEKAYFYACKQRKL